MNSGEGLLARVKSGGRNQFAVAGYGGSGEEQKDSGINPGMNDELDDEEEEDESLSDYKDEDAESDEVDEVAGRSLQIRIKKLVAHDMNIRLLD